MDSSAGLTWKDGLSLAVSFGAASASLYLLMQNGEGGEVKRLRRAEAVSPRQEEKLRAQKARREKLETLIMERGEADTKDYRVHVLAKGQGEMIAELSLWHDVPLTAAKHTDGTPLFNFICEIPKCTRKKYEVATKEVATPIKQDEKKGVLREFKKGDIFFNYGCFPRTWEDPRHVHHETGYPGDNDPLDVCEIGMRQIKTGEIRPVKVLGVLAMIDDDETDWKIVAIDAEDRWADELNDVHDVERLLPGTISLIREWFRTYKIPDGKPPNKFAFEERCLPASYALSVVRETHEAWSSLVDTGHEDLHLPRSGSAQLKDLEKDKEATKGLSTVTACAEAGLTTGIVA